MVEHGAKSSGKIEYNKWEWRKKKKKINVKSRAKLDTQSTPHVYTRTYIHTYINKHTWVHTLLAIYIFRLHATTIVWARDLSTLNPRSIRQDQGEKKNNTILYIRYK